MTSPQKSSPSIDQIDRCLPQTQCTQCDFPRCRDYAEAIANHAADINQCPPGGDITIQALSQLLNRPAKPLNPKHGIHEPKQIAFIHEAECIGCKLCIKACPVECIVGAGKMMHTVIADQCTGCKLCLPVCPTDCIDLIEPNDCSEQTPSLWPQFSEEQVETARFATELALKRADLRETQRKQRHQQSVQRKMQREIMEAVKRNAARRNAIQS